MKKYAIIVAGGSGQRMGAAVPKQFLLLHNKPILYYSINAFLTAYDDLMVILVLPKEHLEKGQAILDMLPEANRVMITEGGETRFHSVKNGLQYVKDESIVFVHDGVRCLVTQQLIHRCYEQAISIGSAIPAVAATDSIRFADQTSHKVVDRNMVRIIQTPQTFQSRLLLDAFQQPYNDTFTDEATVVEAMGEQVHLIEGEHTNLKITRPVDIILAERLIEEQHLL